MRKTLKITLSTFSILTISFFMLAFMVTGCFSFTMKTPAIYKHFDSREQAVKVDFYNFEGKKIRYMTTGDNQKPSVLFVHGAPGSMTNFIDLFSGNLAKHTHLIGLDRLGYGQSHYGESETSISKHAQSIIKLLDTLNLDSVILVGHSFGGPIVCRVAMDFPARVKKLVLIAAAIDPEHEKIFKISYLVSKSNLVRWLTPNSLVVANDEKLQHIAELKAMLPLWSKIKTPTTLIHGKADGLVPFENALFGEKVLTNAALEMVVKDSLGHLIPFKNPELVEEIILKQLKMEDGL